MSAQKSINYFILLVLFLSLSNVGCSKSISTPLELQPPRLTDNDHRGFPATVRLFEPSYDNQLSQNQTKSFLSRLSKLYSPLNSQSSNNQLPFTSRIVSVNLLGGITKVGEYYARIFIGGQPLRVQVDTGSSTLAFPVAECDRCLPGDQRYNRKASKTGAARWISCTNNLCTPDTCQRKSCKKCSHKGACCADENPSACGFQLKYGDGSLARGGLMEDVMTWGNVSSRVIFGGILHDSKDFERVLVDGILGMAYKSLACNPTCVEPPFQQMVKSGAIEDSFAICITQQGGKLVLGEFDKSLAKGDLTYVPLALTDPPTFYTMNMTNRVTIGERSLGIPNLRAGILDSGTTLVVVSQTTFLLFLNHLAKFHCDVPGLCHTRTPWFMPSSCVRISDENLAKLPTFKFHLGLNGEFTLELRPEDYMLTLHKPGHEGMRCVGIMALKKMQRGTDIIFGNTVMQRYVSHYDRKNKRIGFAEAAPGCGLSSMCESYTQCTECSTAKQCQYNFKTKKCTEKSIELGIVPYPDCTGTSCFCGLGPQAGLLFGIITGFVGSFFIMAVALFILALYSRRSFRANLNAMRRNNATYTLADDEGHIEAEEGDLQPMKGYTPVPNE